MLHRAEALLRRYPKIVPDTEVSPRIIEPDQALEVNGRAHGAVFKVSKPTKTADPCAPAEYCRSALPIHFAACIGPDRAS